jgi:hypothetical protein
MKIETEKYIEFTYDELNLSDKELDKLYEIGLNNIKENKRYIIEYTVNKILEDAIPDILNEKDKNRNKIDILKEKIKIAIKRS